MSTKTQGKPFGSTGAIPKKINRQAEIPLNPNDNRQLVFKHQTVCGFEKYQTDKSEKENVKNRYNMPQLNSSLELIHQMKKMNIQKPKKINSTADLTPKSKAILMPQISKKLNFPLDIPIYKNLISLNVNDSLFLPERKQSLRRKYIKTKSKTPVPELTDFLKPLPALTYKIPEPEINLLYIQSDFDYSVDYREFYEQTDSNMLSLN